MWLALVIIVVIIFYGSLFPFNFHHLTLNGELLASFLETGGVQSSLSDVFVNITLFVPLAVIGMLAFPRLASWQKAALVVAIGLMVSVLSQLSQYYVPARIPALQDVLWNNVGVVVGIVVGVGALKFLNRGGDRDGASADPTALFLIFLWLSARFFPFLPSIRLEEYEASLRPLLETPTIGIPQLFISVAGWTVAALLLLDLGVTKRLALTLFVFGAATLMLEVVIVVNTVGLTDVVALVCAVIIVAARSRWALNPAIIAVILMAFALGYAGLDPFQLRNEAAAFNWVPFSATITGHNFFSLKLIVLKLYFYSALVLFVARLYEAPSLYPIILVAGFATAIELVQLFVRLHTPEITDPILVVLGAVIIYSARSSLSRDRRLLMSATMPDQRLFKPNRAGAHQDT
jgi:glycopeptide antibiotics resistance protein